MGSEHLPTIEEADRALTATMRELASFSRVPFRKILAELVGSAPTPEAIKAFAAKYPDKWAAAVSIFAGLAGFEKGLVSLNVYNVGAMSDVQLLAEIAAGDEGLAKLGLRRAPVTIEQEPPQAEEPAPVESKPAVENVRGEPRPAAERGPDGGYVDPAGAV